jgi:hypothetical protein
MLPELSAEFEETPVSGRRSNFEIKNDQYDQYDQTGTER